MKEDRNLKKQIIVAVSVAAGILKALVCGAEALVRWIRPDGSLIYPDEFIPVFEQNGFITDLDMYMLEEACAFLNRLEKNGYADICISVNQSRILFYKADYP